MADSDWYQLTRPSWPHSHVILASHTAFALCLYTAVVHGHALEAAGLTLSAAISVAYHICDENFACAFGWPIATWHALDVWATFFLVCFVLGVMVLDLPSRKARFAARAAYAALVTSFVWYDRGSMLLFGGLLLSVAVAVFFRYAVQRRHLAWGAAKRRARLRYLITGLAIFSLSLGCFVVANTSVIGPVTYDAARDGPVKPMAVPDTAVYYLFHSVWHACSALSAHCIVKFKNG